MASSGLTGRAGGDTALVRVELSDRMTSSASDEVEGGPMRAVIATGEGRYADQGTRSPRHPCA